MTAAVLVAVLAAAVLGGVLAPSRTVAPIAGGLETLRRRLAAKRLALAAIPDEISRLKRLGNPRWTILECQQRDLEAEIEGLEKRVAELEAEVEGLEKRVAELEAEDAAARDRERRATAERELGREDAAYRHDIASAESALLDAGRAYRRASDRLPVIIGLEHVLRARSPEQTISERTLPPRQYLVHAMRRMNDWALFITARAPDPVSLSGAPGRAETALWEVFFRKTESK